MAHPNIYERQKKVKLLLDEAILTHSEIKKQLSLEFNCSPSAIHADIIYFRTKDLDVKYSPSLDNFTSKIS